MIQRTPQQNKSLHVLFREMAKALNESGLTVQKAMEQRMDIDWNEYMVKELIWRPAQKAILGKDSTTQLEKQMDIDEVYEIVMRWFGTLGVERVIFPHDPKKISMHPTYDPGTPQK